MGLGVVNLQQLTNAIGAYNHRPQIVEAERRIDVVSMSVAAQSETGRSIQETIDAVGGTGQWSAFDTELLWRPAMPVYLVAD